MKNLMRSFVNWSNMDKYIGNAFKLYKGYTLAAKAPIKFNPWSKTDPPWSRIHIDFAGPQEGFYNFIVVDSFSKWLEIHRCKNPTTEITIKFLHKLFAKFGAIDTLVSDNGNQFISREFKDFCESYQIDHVTTARSIGGLTDRLIDLWIPWREIWKKFGLSQLKKPFNNSFRYIGLLRIIKHQLHNRQPRWRLHVEYGLCTTNYYRNRRSLEIKHHTNRWCNCYRRRKWTRRHKFKSWTKLIAFHIALISLGKVWIQLFSLQLWINSRTD